MDLGTHKPGASSVTMGTFVRNRAPELSNARDLLTGRPIRRYTTAAAAAAAFNFFGAVFWVRAAALVSMETSEGRTDADGESNGALAQTLTRRRFRSRRPRMGAALTSKRSVGTAAPLQTYLVPQIDCYM